LNHTALQDHTVYSISQYYDRIGSEAEATTTCRKIGLSQSSNALAESITSISRAELIEVASEFSHRNVHLRFDSKEF